MIEANGGDDYESNDYGDGFESGSYNNGDGDGASDDGTRYTDDDFVNILHTISHIE